MRNCLRVTTMKIFTPVRGILIAGVFGALALASQAQVVELRATINAAQEAPNVSTSPATGTAIMLYDIKTNTFDLMVSINGMANAAISSHIHEAAAGAGGPVVTNLGSESVYTRSGNTLTATFRNITHGGDRLKLIQGGAYFNIHSAQFPQGEVRGQLIPQPIRLVAVMDVAQEQAALPTPSLAGLNDFGGAVMFYNPVTNTTSLRMSLFNFLNSFTNSHFHSGAPGVPGPVVVDLGRSATAGNYVNPSPGYISGSVDNLVMVSANGTPIDPFALLTGGLYLNFHSATFAGGELRGQVRVSNETPSARLANLSVRGFVGTGEQVLIQGLTVNGTEPVRVAITAKGPSLSNFGIGSPLANPRVALYDSGRREIAANDDVGTVAAGSELARIPGFPTNTVESALVLVLPPGNYTAVVSAASGTGIALLEVTDLRNLGASAATASVDELKLALLREPSVAPAKTASAGPAGRGAVELCETPIAAVVAKR